MRKISFTELTSYFDKNDWDFSYLTYEEFVEVSNFPIKMNEELINNLTLHDFEFPKTGMILVICNKTNDFDYSLERKFFKKINQFFPYFKGGSLWCNYKYAAMRSGLGQYAKNSLIYHPRFQFETHFLVVLVENEIIDLPVRNKANYQLLEQCNNCFDCFNSCPVKAINNIENYYWIDMEKCDNFNMFNNDEKIPSVKENWAKIEACDLTEEELYNITNMRECFEKTQKNIHHCSLIKNEIVDIIYPICRECTSQPKCSKYNGKYPYNKNDVKIFT